MVNEIKRFGKFDINDINLLTKSKCIHNVESEYQIADRVGVTRLNVCSSTRT